MEISTPVTKPSCYNQGDIPKWTETSVLQVLQMPRVQNVPSKLHQDDILKEPNTYLWVTGPSIGLSAWIPLEACIRCTCGEHGPFGQQWRLGLCLHSVHPLRGEGAKEARQHLSFSQHRAKKFLSVREEMWIMVSVIAKHEREKKNFSKNFSARVLR